MFGWSSRESPGGKDGRLRWIRAAVPAQDVERGGRILHELRDAVREDRSVALLLGVGSRASDLGVGGAGSVALAEAGPQGDQRAGGEGDAGDDGREHGGAAPGDPAPEALSKRVLVGRDLLTGQIAAQIGAQRLG